MIDKSKPWIKIGNIDYHHLPYLAPTKEILNEYKNNNGDWAQYEEDFYQLMVHREIEKQITHDLLDKSCLLCSEHKPDQCHRRLVAEYLQRIWGNVEIIHLVT